MGFGNFDSAQLSVVGYAHVRSDGTSPDCNSGLVIAKSSTGNYTVALPVSQTQANDRVFFEVTPIDSGPVFHWVQNVGANLRVIIFENPSPAPTDTEFQLVVLRTIDPPPAGAPA